MSITIREFGTLAVGENVTNSLDHQDVSQSSFEVLKALALEERSEGQRRLFRLISRKGRECVQVLNYVGLVSLPNGEQVEILPKTSHTSESVSRGRNVLLKMLSKVHDLHFHESNMASLDTLNRPWLEILIRHVLLKTASLARAGFKKRYDRIQKKLPAVKGKILVSKQLRNRPGADHQFHLEFDEYNLNRPENRLLKAALIQLSRWSTSSENLRLCNEMLFSLDEVPPSRSHSQDLKMWSKQRDMVLYQPLLPWIKLILQSETPIFGKGSNEGISLLFPMERLFEEYVAICLKRQVESDYALRTQTSSKSLVKHQGQDWFKLKPDILIKHKQKNIAVLDTKWKLIDQRLSTSDRKYGLSQSDFYQMFAYGEKYLSEGDRLALIFPKSERFESPLPEFCCGNKQLLVLPFDLETDRLIVGDNDFRCFKAHEVSPS